MAEKLVKKNSKRSLHVVPRRKRERKKCVHVIENKKRRRGNEPQLVRLSSCDAAFFFSQAPQPRRRFSFISSFFAFIVVFFLSFFLHSLLLLKCISD